MAEKAQQAPNPNEFKGAGAASDQEQLDKIAASAAERNKKLAEKDEKQTNGPDPEAIKSHWDDIEDADKDRLLKKKAYDKAQQTLRNRYSVAKAAGVNTKAIKRLRKMQEENLDELDEELQEVARIAGIVGSPVVQLSSFATMLADADQVNPFTQGYTAGKAGDNADTNPHKPGSEKFEKWAHGWKDGQAKLMNGMFKGNDRAAGTTPSEKKKRAARKKKR